jgi:hypothetical protein
LKIESKTLNSTSIEQSKKIENEKIDVKYQYIDESDKVALRFEIFYWAAYMGRIDMVEEFIRAGYSPIVKSHKNIKNAIFACVLGDQYETLVQILNFSYLPRD